METWEALLRWLDTEHTVNPPTLKTTAQELHAGFAHALFEILKLDFAEGGKAFPALLLMLVSNTNAAVKETIADVKDIKSGVETLT